MVATVTFASANQPRHTHDASTVDIFQWATAATYAGGTSSTGAVHFMSLKIPHGATILDMIIHHRQDTSTAGFGHNVGIAGGITSSVLLGSESFSSTTRAVSMAQSPTGGVAFPYKVSISDDNATRYVYPTVTTIGTGTNSITVSVGVQVRYTMNKTNAGAQ